MFADRLGQLQLAPGEIWLPAMSGSNCHNGMPAHIPKQTNKPALTSMAQVSDGNYSGCVHEVASL